MSKEQEREAFEAWFSDDGKHPFSVERATDGSYRLLSAHTNWGAWQAAWNTRAALASPAAEHVERNNPISALAIRMLVAAGHVTQEKADEAFRLACSCLENEARRLNIELPWVTRTVPASPAAEPVQALPKGWEVERGVSEFDATPWVSVRNVESQCSQAFYEDHAPLMFAFLAALASPPATKEAKALGFVKPDNDRQVFFYEQDFYVLSNFSSFTLDWKGIRFDTSEAAYHWEKFIGKPAVMTAIQNSPSAHEAFKVAEHYKPFRRTDWDEVKVGIMRAILRAKADQHEYVRRKLLATGDRELIEDSWRDSYWGWGQNRDGQNMLGKLWMEVRAELRARPEGAA